MSNTVNRDKRKPWLPATWDYEADVVVMGFGGAGATAALTAHDAGARVIVLEKDPLGRGGNTGCSGAGQRIGVDQESTIEYLRAQCWGTVTDEELIRTHVKAVQSLPKWYESLGATVFWRSGDLVGYPLLPGAKGFAGNRPCGYFFSTDGKDPGLGMGGNVLFRFLSGLVRARNIDVKLGTPAKSLIQDPVSKEILGVFAEAAGKTISVKAKKGVILSCGGYENNPEMRNNFGPHTHSGFITFYGCSYNTGDGIIMAQRVGAKLWHMNKKECHAFACVPATKEIGVGVVVKAYGTPGGQAAIYVNRDGKRFMNEYFYNDHTDRHKEYDIFEHRRTPTDDYDYSDYRNLPMYWIFDETLRKAGPLREPRQWVGIHKLWVWSEDSQAELKRGWLLKSDTVEGLAKQIMIHDFHGRLVGMNVQGLVETVAKYNQYCKDGKDPEFGRRPSTLKPLNNPPYYAMEICECITNTQGGPQHNKYGQTLDVDNVPIPRLYSIGELGSIYGFLYNGGGNVAEAVAFGRIAGKHAADLKPWA
ncbi:MAG: FAD-binding protein [Chloroflexi bacterium]|nr:FAD-binding protein [Chloroflexota bacterium]